ncbi:alpha-ribazole phosphatase [Aquimarina sp. MMG016]|uniref:alpha-ribazole phosphatase n=1 Tax=Aquimarina sp. MMG016 TaxID=2822690 RepID=UPI001B3A33AF|nr:alpha-ribazole phosphatase [Aquimarina sp. MMG016]MBQ4821750.1 alpha-ribazole phosphatase [Aquimarina sp. MMG016]
MEIHLVRHTTPDIKKGICYGQSNLGVTDSFQSEVEKIHQQIPINKIDKIYSSPLQRCKRLAETFNHQIIFDDRLKELNFGDWELKPWDDINQKEIDPWMKDFVNVQVPNGESYVMLQQRVMEFYKSLYHSSTEKIVIVTHAGPMRALIASLQEIELKDSFSIKIGYGEVIKI